MFPTTILCIIFLCLSGLHVYWAFGGEFGIKGAIPTKDNKPLFEVNTIGALAVAFALLCAGLLIAWKGWFPSYGSAWISSVGVWLLAALFSLRAIGDFRYAGFFKRIRGTKFARNDTLIFSPLCVLIAVLLIVLLINEP